MRRRRSGQGDDRRAGLASASRSGASLGWPISRRSRPRTSASSSAAASRATSGSSRWRSRTRTPAAAIVVDRRHLHPGGFVHGGAWTALGDTVAAWATFRNIPPGHDFTTIELKLNVFGSGLPGDEIVATADAPARRPQHGRDRGPDRARSATARRKLAANLIVTQFVLPPGR